MKIEEIKNPQFLKKMKKEELPELSEDIRKFLLQKISKTGGHLSSNLGIVELTVALHKIFDASKDKIIFDVGHQCYTHKILTGRAKDFETLRQYKGLSGFQKRGESIYDVYEAGHSSTSISAALGFAVARDINHKKHHVIAVIGDGSIGNGLAYEALNHIGELKPNLLVILNDNEMSISKNVGALHNHLDELRMNLHYRKFNEKTKFRLEKIPVVGKKISYTISNVKESLKRFYLKEGYFFEQLGFKYYGPIHGHDFNELLFYLEKVKKVKGPVLLHVITKKGKGYSYAEEDAEGYYHGVSSFNLETGKPNSISAIPTWSEVIASHLINLAKKDKDLMVITPAMMNGAKLKTFRKNYPSRFIDVGIAEEHAIILGNALALEGKHVFISMYSTFLQRGYDEILHDVARMNTPLILGIDRAGIVGEDGETHQGIYDVAFLSHIPNMIIASPKDSKEAGNLLYSAPFYNRPFAIRYSRRKTFYQKQSYEKIELGSWEKIKDGKDATIISYGDFLGKALNIHENLKKKHINIEVVNARFIKPWDQNYFDNILEKNKPIFVYEEVSKISSLGQMLSSYSVSKSDVKIYLFSIEDQFVLQGKDDLIIKDLGLDEDTIVKKIENILEG